VASQSLRAHASTLLVGNLLSQAFAFFSFLIVARTAGPGGFGHYIVFYSLSMVAGDVLDFGVSRRLLRDGREPESRFVLMQVLRARLMILVVASAAATYVGGNLHLIVLALAVGLGRAVSLATQYWLQSRAYLFRSVMVSLTERVVSLAVLLAATSDGGPWSEAAWALWAGTTSAAVTAAIVAFVVPVPEKARDLVRMSLLRALLWGRAFALGVVAVNLMLLDSAIVSAISGAASAAYFGVGSRMVSPLLLPISAMALGLMAVHSLARSDHSLIRVVIMTASLILCGLGLTTGFWVPLIFGASFEPAIVPAAFYCFATIFSVLGSPLIAGLQRQGHQALVGRLLLAGVLACLLMLAAGAVVGAAQGAAAGYFVGQVATFALIGSAYRRRMRYQQ